MSRRYCFVPNCSTGYPSSRHKKISIFKAPRNPDLLQIWIKTIPRKNKEFTATDSVCAKHFKKEDIITGWKSGGISFPYSTPRLSKNAIPTIFPSCTENDIKQSTEIIEVFTEPKTKRQKLKKEAEAGTNCSLTKYVPPVEQEFISLFTKIYNRNVSISLPDESWAIYNINKQYICISQIDVRMECPITLRQILIMEDMTLKFFIRERNILNMDKFVNFTNPLTRIDHLEAIINQIQNVNICSGGPSTKLYPQQYTISSKIASLDDNHWRHHNCSFIYEGSNSCCNNCLELYKTENMIEV